MDVQDEFDAGDYVGLPFETARELAASRGWSVRKIDEQGALTLDRRGDRLNLIVNQEQQVVRADLH
jgi:hypothetical protein